MDGIAFLKRIADDPSKLTDAGETYVVDKFALPKKADTQFKGSNGKQYDVESVVLLLQHGSNVAQYTKETARLGIQPIAFTDRRPIVSFIKGQTATCQLLSSTVPPLQAKPVESAKRATSHDAETEAAQPSTKRSTATTAATGVRSSAAVDREIKRIIQRERLYQSRSTVLQSKGSKTFGKVLQLMNKLKEEAQKSKAAASGAETYQRYDQPAREEDAFGIDMAKSYVPGTILAKEPEKKDKEAAKPRKKTKRTPIIVVPAGTQSLITMYNVKDFLEKGVYTDYATLTAAGRPKPLSVVVSRKREDHTVPYRVVDNPSLLKLEEWERVVAVVVQGATWQFKSWPETLNNKGPVDIFRKRKGFHFMYNNDTLNKNVSKWDVEVLKLNRTRRHMDRTAMYQFWQSLDKWTSKHFPDLRC
eukprot:TRINITY_DN12238_c0_g1_i1.p1 TRINITY_DN12238_c0_g1~~TRINITY_DN12238_c0_g1_i1.p1  ORF type:complete len:437 (+),score=109.81 TRINITY_DN12238_c0_g1_i1:61-1311(+)